MRWLDHGMNHFDIEYFQFQFNKFHSFFVFSGFFNCGINKSSNYLLLAEKCFITDDEGIGVKFG